MLRRELTMKFLTGKSIRAIVIMSSIFALGTLALAPRSQAQSNAYNQGAADGERAGKAAARDDQPPDEKEEEDEGGCCGGS